MESISTFHSKETCFVTLKASTVVSKTCTPVSLFIFKFEAHIHLYDLQTPSILLYRWTIAPPALTLKEDWHVEPPFVGG